MKTQEYKSLHNLLASTISFCLGFAHHRQKLIVLINKMQSSIGKNHGRNVNDDSKR